MFKPKRNRTESNLSAKGQRYWSLMLVGEHGRVIPFRRFKEFAIGVVVLTILSIGSLVVLGFLYFQQAQSIAELEKQIGNLKAQNTALKNERDVLVARVGIKKASSSIAAANSTAKDDEAQTAAPSKVEPVATPKVEQPQALPPKSAEKEAVKKPAPEPAISWRADIRNSSTDYDHKQQVLTTRFRVYNVSKPKKQLSGRIVVVYKNNSDSRVKWMTVPRVSLVDGKPVGDKGQAFQVRNYRTMTFTSYRQKYPIDYDTASVYVFLPEGKLILSKDLSISISPPPKPSPKPTPTPTPAPTPVKEEATPDVNPNTPTGVVAPDSVDRTDGEQVVDNEAPGGTSPSNGQTTPTSDSSDSDLQKNEETAPTEPEDPTDRTENPVEQIRQ